LNISRSFFGLSAGRDQKTLVDGGFARFSSSGPQGTITYKKVIYKDGTGKKKNNPFRLNNQSMKNGQMNVNFLAHDGF